MNPCIPYAPIKQRLMTNSVSFLTAYLPQLLIILYILLFTDISLKDKDTLKVIPHIIITPRKWQFFKIIQRLVSLRSCFPYCLKYFTVSLFKSVSRQGSRIPFTLCGSQVSSYLCLSSRSFFLSSLFVDDRGHLPYFPQAGFCRPDHICAVPFSMFVCPSVSCKMEIRSGEWVGLRLRFFWWDFFLPSE